MVSHLLVSVWGLQKMLVLEKYSASSELANSLFMIKTIFLPSWWYKTVYAAQTDVAQKGNYCQAFGSNNWSNQENHKKQ